MRFYNGADKIKSLRKQLGLNQGDLEDEHISRGLISMIETNRREITYTVASRLADKFNEKAEKLGLTLNITEEYLTRTEKEEAEIYCLSKLKNNDLTQEQFHDIFEIDEKYNLPQVKAKAYVDLGDINLKNKNYDDACIDYDKSIKLYKSLYLNRELAYIYFQIGKVHFISFHYESALVYFNLSQNYAFVYDDKETYKMCLDKVSTSYLRTGKIQLALDTVNKLLSFIKENKKDKYYLLALNTKAICYGELKEYDKANDIYKGLINLYLDENKHGISLGYIYTNLGVNYCYLNNFEESLRYFEMGENIRMKIDKPRVCHTIFEKANVYVKQNFYDKAIETLKESLKYANEYDQLDYLLRGHNMLKDIYIKLNDDEKLENECFELIKLLKITDDKVNLKVIYDKLVFLYLKQGKSELVTKYISLSDKLEVGGLA
ncbi:MAG: helix-turn-helix transcriptional regulator [Clostridium sp.]|nr:helix-turn-helix transcriptional regulator [Clostridium sp.]